MEHAPETNECLIARVKDLADGAAWSDFWGIYQPIVLRLARARGMQDADAQDVCQKVMLAVSQSLPQWEPRVGQPFRAWLGRIARNAILNAITRRPRDVGTGLSAVAEQLNQIAQVDSADDMHELHRETQSELFGRAIHDVRAEFAESTWAMFWETEVNALAVEEVAQRYCRSVGAVYVARCRVMKRLREFVQGECRIWGLETLQTKGTDGE